LWSSTFSVSVLVVSVKTRSSGRVLAAQRFQGAGQVQGSEGFHEPMRSSPTLSPTWRTRCAVCRSSASMRRA
jgi:hypothetical protein